MRNRKKPGRLPVNVHEALAAIATTGKGRCWYCDARLPDTERAIEEGWDVQRIDEHPVASIILVCPRCLRQETPQHSPGSQVRGSQLASAGSVHSASRNGHSGLRAALSFEPKRA